MGNRGGSGHIKSYQGNGGYNNGYSQQSSYDNQQMRRKNSQQST